MPHSPETFRILINQSINLSLRVAATRYLIEFHWLPIKVGVKFKICLIIYKAFKSDKPNYIIDLLSNTISATNFALRTISDLLIIIIIIIITTTPIKSLRDG